MAYWMDPTLGIDISTVRLLTEKLGYQVSAADPCLYYYFNEKNELEGVIAVATDDLLHGGTENGSTCNGSTDTTNWESFPEEMKDLLERK